MDAEKNVVEAARRVIDWAGRGWPTVFDPLREAIAAYDSAPDPSEDRVREAAGEYEFVLTGEVREPKVGEWYVEHYGAQVATIDWPEHKANKRSILHRRVTPAPAPSEDRVRKAAEAVVDALLTAGGDKRGDRLVIKQGPLHNERDLGGNCRGSAIYWAGEALKPYVTPAPALPAGTVAVNVETLREGVAVLNRAYLGGINRGDDDVAKSHNALSKILPPPPRPEPSAGLVEEWKAAARAESDKAYDAKLAALRAAWEADPKGKQ